MYYVLTGLEKQKERIERSVSHRHPITRGLGTVGLGSRPVRHL